MTEEDLYRAAREKTDAIERATYLDNTCAGDPDLRRRIEARLNEPADDGTKTAPLAGDQAGAGANLDRTSVLIDQTVAGAASTAMPVAVGRQIGPYKLWQKLGEGGMGVVYLALQEHPVRRRVALKIIRPGIDNSALILRFQVERQALADMDHPNISRVLDAGSTDTGQPYFVMELVEGVPITRYCDENRATIRERLQMVVPVCRAIQHAHQKGIVHRDIKPSNVLVAVHDGEPVPKVIDFGVAKATDRKLTEDTLYTQFGVLVGTLEYMSPEQAELSPAGVDTRSDVYSLGVLLYELLTGGTPLVRDLPRQARYVETLEIIRNQEPQRPGQRIASATDLDSLGARRRAEPARLARLVRGELDWIVMKALEKDRTRRYATADAFARDLERYLHDEPVEAGPPSAMYRMRKFVNKHRGWFAAATAFFLVVLSGAVVSGWLGIRAMQAEAQARKQKARADEEKRSAEAVSDFLRNDLLAQASAANQSRPGVRSDQNVTVRTLLDRAAERIAGKFEGKPLVEAAVRQTIGDTYSRLGLYPQAEAQMERARVIRARELGEDESDTLASTSNLASVYEAQGRYDLAEPLLTGVYEVRLRKFGEDDSETLIAMNNLGLLYHTLGRQGRAVIRACIGCRKTIGGPRSPGHASDRGEPAACIPVTRQFSRCRTAAAACRGDGAPDPRRAESGIGCRPGGAGNQSVASTEMAASGCPTSGKRQPL